jgi:hypothetical protein
MQTSPLKLESRTPVRTLLKKVSFHEKTDSPTPSLVEIVILFSYELDPVSSFVSLHIVGRETALSPFKEFAVHRGMYGKVSRSSFLSFLSYIGHGVAVIRQFVEIQLTPR